MGGFFGLNSTIAGQRVEGNALGKGGFFGEVAAPVAVSHPFHFTATAPNSTGPFNAVLGFPFGSSEDLGAFCDGQTSGGVSYGILNPNTTAINGSRITTIGYSDTDPSTNVGFGIALKTNAAVAQSYFTKLVIGAPINITLLTATADYFNSNAALANFTIWAWARPGDPSIFGPSIPVSWS
jgi:hypothetical protein